jgi:hypothetical protein
MTIDVTQILSDPDLATLFDVKRRSETVDSNGISQVSTTTFEDVIGVITVISPNNLDRHENYQTMRRSISVICRFDLRGEVDGYQPDVVVWQGNNYVVKVAGYYPQFGEGFVQAECTSMDHVDKAVSATLASQLTFSKTSNSSYVAVL